MEGTKPIGAIEPDDQRLVPQHVKRALVFMNANMAEKITLTELASVCAVPERTLLKQFQRFIGLPPLAYLRRLRLNSARSELVKAESRDAISDIAIRCGFSHLGRFAGEYRRAFGESPTATRQRVRARAAGSAVAENRASYSGDNTTPASVCVVGCKKPSLLILPLRTETLQERLEARDLSERLAATLSRMRVASVALANTSHSLPMNAPQPRNVGTQYRLLGRLTQRGQRVRVVVRLVDVAADRHVWGDSFDGSVNDPFELQDRVVDGVLCGVVAKITDAETELASSKDPKDASARDLAFQALPLILAANAACAQKAVATLDRAVENDPADAVAVALLAFCQIELVGRYATESPGTAVDAAVRLSQRAGLLDNNDPLVLVARAGVAGWLQQYEQTDALLTRALAMDSTSAWAWERYAYARLSDLPIGVRDAGETGEHRLSRPERADRAIADFHRALQLRGPGMARSNCFHGIAAAHCMAGRWDDAMLWMRKALVENPNGAWIHRNVSCLAFKMGDLAGVAQSVDHMRRAHPYLTVSYHADNFPVGDLGWIEALASAGMPLV
jgi:AraC-like DNA-binding protein/TolB-like protein